MWTSTRRFRADQAMRSRHVGVAIVALLACVSVTACTVAETPSPAATTEAPTVAPLPESGDLDAGTYLVTGFTVPFEITVPDGWESFGWGVLKADSDDWQVFVNFLSPTSVPTDACAWEGTLVDVDPSPEAYVEAMAAQTSTQTTPPVAIVMGDYSGFEFDYAVESDVDLTTCDAQRLCLFADGDANTCTRTHGGVDERETERVVDLNGELAMIAVGQFIEVDPALTAEARAVFESIEFAPDA